MKYGEIVRRLAPCGLDCSRCVDYEDGEIRRLALRLLELLGNYERLALMKADFDSAFKHYSEFRTLLTRFSEASCGGCRSDHARSPVQCSVRACYREEGVDFCFQCKTYPCEKGLSGLSGERWKKMNDRMQELGVEAYYDEQAKKPRY
jgi:hypothetical protein